MLAIIYALLFVLGIILLGIGLFTKNADAALIMSVGSMNLWAILLYESLNIQVAVSNSSSLQTVSYEPLAYICLILAVASFINILVAMQAWYAQTMERDH